MAQRRNMKAIQICLDIADKYRAKQPQPPQTETNIAVITPGAKLINAALRGELPPAVTGPKIEVPLSAGEKNAAIATTVEPPQPEPAPYVAPQPEPIKTLSPYTKGRTAAEWQAIPRRKPYQIVSIEQRYIRFRGRYSRIPSPVEHP